MATRISQSSEIKIYTPMGLVKAQQVTDMIVKADIHLEEGETDFSGHLNWTASDRVEPEDPLAEREEPEEGEPSPRRPVNYNSTQDFRFDVVEHIANSNLSVGGGKSGSLRIVSGSLSHPTSPNEKLHHRDLNKTFSGRIVW